ncbi:cation channel sperm-associated protein subunit gamma isoform X1 [Crotalus tigris]|uniref:cation channel sperm-associated protein subunit gamma isoform X1 n=1 Tax=Crotalus tigris TaxID=88082 RepID=UPI00192F5EF5|nr:cation channel sperm-associated protein subunit gamma isoform X1 [Crotalus tigris]XP_039225095.1 cation channel sperm-associated protein subunit gamma isoform X1 [Crotalus tigris]
MWQPFLPSLLFLLLQLKLCLSLRQCKWFTSLIDTPNLMGLSSSFINQEEVREVAAIFHELKDSPVDPNDKDARYYGFPYFLKVTLFCIYRTQQMAIRVGHYSGLRPIVRVSFEEPVNPVRQKQERLRIEMMTAPHRMNDSDYCDSEEVCKMFWFAPMPFLNGSVVTRVLVRTNGFGLPILNRRFYININGYMEPSERSERFRIGKKLYSLKKIFGLKDPSRPLWATHQQAPVLILGGIPEKKVVIISDTSFDTFHVIEVGIDSCWIGSVLCPQGMFSSSIVDTIATESTLFIRQNQLVYYFTGHYPILHLETKGSELWTRILNNVCVKKLVPVFFPYNNSEYVIALGGGAQDGEFFLITCKDGVVKASASLRQQRRSICFLMFRAACSILWASLTHENKFHLLVMRKSTNASFVVSYDREYKKFQALYHIPSHVPKASDKGFVMLLGTEVYTKKRLIARGLAYNPFSKAFYIWGNVILQSQDMTNYIYLSNFPSDSPIKDFVLSFKGPFAVVTDREELWVSNENGIAFRKVYPSDAWNKFVALQTMRGSTRYPQSAKQAIVSIFYNKEGLHELVYTVAGPGKERLLKRDFPQDTVLTYDLLISTPHKKMTFNGKDYIRFTHRCPFAALRVLDLPHPQRFTRVEHYWATPPDVMEKSGFHDERSLTVYQGLVYQLLQLHTSYHRSYADPVHDPTWRWWKNQKEEAEYFNYKASNWKSLGGIYVDMANYAKIYNLMPDNDVPDTIYLDKNTAYSFNVFLTIRTARESLGETAEENSLHYIWLAIILAHPEYVQTELQRQELISRGSVLYRVTIKDNGKYPIQQLSGKNLLKSSAGLKIVRSEMSCYHHTTLAPQLKGTDTMGIYIGCPPGKRLAFDITYTKNYTTEKNKRYFDCVEPDPEMPCFFFSDVFFPSFLIQDMVTGDSGQFHGSYLFSIIGGGAFSQSNIRYFTQEEIVKYNTNSNESALIWARADIEINQTNDEGFPVLSGTNSGIVWICQKDSPCYDIVPQSMAAPDYYFVIKVSNRGVDQTTYCDYALEFIIHIHGLRLSPDRALYVMKISMATVIGLVVLYIVVDVVAPWLKQHCNRLVRKLEEVIAFRAESSLTFSSSFSSQSSLQKLPSDLSQGDPSINIPFSSHIHSRKGPHHHGTQ